MNEPSALTLPFDTVDAELEKHSVTIAGHRTSVSLERGFWRHLKRLAADRQLSLNDLLRQLDEARTGSLSGAARAFVLQALEREIGGLIPSKRQATYARLCQSPRLRLRGKCFEDNLII